jgi:hypothetical protein
LCKNLGKVDISLPFHDTCSRCCKSCCSLHRLTLETLQSVQSEYFFGGGSRYIILLRKLSKPFHERKMLANQQKFVATLCFARITRRHAFQITNYLRLVFITTRLRYVSYAAGAQIATNLAVQDCGNACTIGMFTPAVIINAIHTAIQMIFIFLLLERIYCK